MGMPVGIIYSEQLLLETAVAVKEWLEESGVKGIVRFYGTPAEEGGSGKVYIAREGFFDDVDIVLHWHPSSANSVTQEPQILINRENSLLEEFQHMLPSSPEKGRSALDGVESCEHDGEYDA